MVNNRRTDLALEARELINNQTSNNPEREYKDPPGVDVEHSGSEDIRVTRVRVTSPEGESSIGKPMGNYITIEVPRLKENDQVLYEQTCEILAKELVAILNLTEKSKVFVVGLGNWNVTPDSLGPKVLEGLMITRHLHEYVPEQLQNGIRPVCAIAPGVLGITGIETSEIVKGIVDKVKPDIVIAIDALASRRMERVNTTIQVADTGISPGSGVGNKRMELSMETMGIPVIAIGVPTVVDAATMANDTIDLVIDNLIKEAGNDKNFYDMLKSIDRTEKYQLIQEVLKPYIGDLIVTPKEVDEVVDRISKVIANGLNIALHQGITLNNMNRYVQ